MALPVPPALAPLAPWISAVPAYVPSRLVEVISFPVRASIAFGQASIGVAQLVAPEGPARLLTMLSTVTAPDRPLGQALAPGGVVDRLLDDAGVLARLSQRGGVLDRLIAPGGLFDRILVTDGTVDRLVAPDGPLDRILESGGALDRLLAQEGAIDRMLAEGGVIDRLLAQEGLIEQLVAEGGIIDRLGELMVNIDRLGPVLETLGPVLDGVREAAGGIDRSARGLDRSAGELVTLLEPVSDVVGRIPGTRKRRTSSGSGSVPITS